MAERTSGFGPKRRPTRPHPPALRRHASWRGGTRAPHLPVTAAKHTGASGPERTLAWPHLPTLHRRASSCYCRPRSTCGRCHSYLPSMNKRAAVCRFHWRSRNGEAGHGWHGRNGGSMYEQRLAAPWASRPPLGAPSRQNPDTTPTCTAIGHGRRIEVENDWQGQFGLFIALSLSWIRKMNILMSTVSSGKISRKHSVSWQMARK